MKTSGHPRKYTHTHINVKQATGLQLSVRSAHMGAYYCAQLQYTIQQRTDMIIFPMINTTRMVSTGREEIITLHMRQQPNGGP